MNSLTAAELKRRGMSAIEEGLRRGPVHLMKHNKPSAVVLSEDDYAKLSHAKSDKVVGVSAIQWLLDAPATGKRRRKSHIDKTLREERANWK